jgi:hypothetical protein
LEDKTTADKLRDLLKGEPIFAAPEAKQFVSPHYEFIFGIGNDHTLCVTMDKEAYEELFAHKIK